MILIENENIVSEIVLSDLNYKVGMTPFFAIYFWIIFF